MTREDKMILITRNSDFTYEELETMHDDDIDTLYETHVLEKNGG